MNPEPNTGKMQKSTYLRKTLIYARGQLTNVRKKIFVWLCTFAIICMQVIKRGDSNSRILREMSTLVAKSLKQHSNQGIFTLCSLLPETFFWKHLGGL
jgi:hypothetical protein